MTYINIFLVLNIALSIYLIFQHRLLNAIIAEGIVSSLSAALFFLLKAPDIAITQVAIGSGFLTFLFIVSIKIKERIIVAYCNESTFIYTINNKYYGISVEILERFAKIEGMEMEYKKINENDILKSIKDGKIDIYIGISNIETDVPKIHYANAEEIILRKDTGNKLTQEYETSNLLQVIKDSTVKEVKTILPSLLFVRNKIKNIKIERTKKQIKLYFYLNPYNSDLKSYLTKFISKNKDFINEVIEKYV